jgi:TrmH family RNA methyltransferase
VKTLSGDFFIFKEGEKMEKFKIITSKDNSLIKLVCALQSQTSARKEHNLFVLEGLRICDDAMTAAIKFDKLIVSETAEKKYESFIKAFSKNAVECYKIPDSLFKKISDTTSPQGVIAICEMPQKNTNIDKNGRYVALENINDPSNLGAVSRTAEALGVSGIILSANGCDPYSPKSLRASMGTLLRMPIIVFDDFVESIKNSGLKSYACVVDSGAKSITDVSFQDGSVVMIGNEANGLTFEAKAVASEQITIKMTGKAESLNAATAAAISIWEMMK